MKGGVLIHRLKIAGLSLSKLSLEVKILLCFFLVRYLKIMVIHCIIKKTRKQDFKQFHHKEILSGCSLSTWPAQEKS